MYTSLIIQITLLHFTAWNTELVRSQWVCSERFHPKSLKKVKTRKEIEIFGQYGRCVFQELGVYNYIFDEFHEDVFPAGYASKYLDLYIEILKECKEGLGFVYNFQFFYDLLKCADISSILKYFWNKVLYFDFYCLELELD